MAIIKTEQLTKDYGSADTAVRALDRVDMQIESGELVAVVGPSGCGKSTLLQLLGGYCQVNRNPLFFDAKSIRANTTNQRLSPTYS